MADLSFSVITLTLLVFAPLLLGLLAFILKSGRLAEGAGIILSMLFLGLLAPLSGAVLAEGSISVQLGSHAPGLAIPLYVDGLSLAMLWLTTLLALAIQVYSADWTHRKGLPAGNEYRWLWLFLWSGLNALFLSGDLFNLYVTLEVTTLAAVPLVLLSLGRGAMDAANRYLMYALVGSIFFLLGVALIYAHSGLLAMPALEDHQLEGPAPLAALLLMTMGVAMKAALFPAHGWLPKAHAAAPAPASALLSAIVAKAGAYLLIRLWLGPLNGVWSLPMAQFLGVIGAVGILFASIQALRQSRLKLVIAYSTVAQLAYLLLVVPLGTLMAWNGVIYHALSHGLAKAAFFLAAGNLILVIGDDRLTSLAGSERVLPKSILSIGLAGVAISGLPPSGGFLAKWWMISAALETGQWWWAGVIALGGILAAAYTFRVLSYAFSTKSPHADAPTDSTAGHLPRLLVWPPLLLALAAVALGLGGYWLAPFIESGSPLGGGS